MFGKKCFLILLIHVFAIQIYPYTVKYQIEVDSAKIMFFYGPTFNDYQEYDLDDAVSLLQHPKFVNKQTTIFMHGYNNTKDNPSTKLLVSSYLKNNSTNFLNINWAEMSKGTYISAQLNILGLSPRLADFIISLFESGLEEDSLSLLGNSLGALGVGLIGRDVIERSNGSMILSRISAFDPSNEQNEEVILPPIDKSVAKFIDVIHADAGEVGTKMRMGHADFWPNNGISLQPGCPAKTIRKKCSHRKATAYWAESVENKGTESLLAFSSGSYDELLKNGPDHYKDSAVLMGIDCPSSARGNFYLKLNTTYGDFYPVYWD